MPAISAPMSLKQRDAPLTFTPVLKTEPIITWEKLPDDFELPDDPVDNLTQPLLAEALRDGFLESARLRLSQSRIIGTNFGIAAIVNGKNVIKAPDWVYVPSVLPLPDGKEYKSYTPHAQGAIPEIVMEFLSDTEGREYNRESVYPYGKWYFYEQILKVPFYAIFEPESGLLECYHRKKGYYKRLKLSKQGRYWITSLNLSLGVWEGTREDSDRTGYWLRWWNADDHLLLWKSEKVEQVENEKQLALEKAKQAEAEKQAALEKAKQAEAEKQAALEKAKQAEAEKQAVLEKAGQAEKIIRRMVQQLLQANTDIAVIMQITGLDKVEIENMKSNERKSN